MKLSSGKHLGSTTITIRCLYRKACVPVVAYKYQQPKERDGSQNRTPRGSHEDDRPFPPLPCDGLLRGVITSNTIYADSANQ